MSKTDFKVEMWDITKPKAYESNPRQIGMESVAKTAMSIEKYGWRQPIVVDENNIILAGHTRLLAGEYLKQKQVPVHVAVGLTDEEKRAYRIADNRTAQESQWDLPLLAEELKFLEDEEFDLKFTGFDTTELDELLKNVNEGLTDEDEVPEVTETYIKVGDVFELGNHKIVCGDSLDEKNLQTLLNDKKADMVFTDPPYNADYKSRGKNEMLREGIKNDNMSDSKFQIFAENIFKTVKSNIYKGSSIYICCNWKDSYPRFYFIAEKNNINVSNCIVWNKESAGMGWNDYRYQFEFILYGFEKARKHNFYGDRTNTDLWSLKREARSSYEHPTQKPVELVEKAITNSSLQEQLVLDLFLGSGSTLIACEKVNRKCYGIELDPRYVDVIIQRWENYTGKKAKKIN